MNLGQSSIAAVLVGCTVFGVASGATAQTADSPREAARLAADRLIVGLEDLEQSTSATESDPGYGAAVGALLDRMRVLRWELDVEAPREQVRGTYREIQALKRELIERGRHTQGEISASQQQLAALGAELRRLAEYFEAR